MKSGIGLKSLFFPSGKTVTGIKCGLPRDGSDSGFPLQDVEPILRGLASIHHAEQDIILPDAGCSLISDDEFLLLEQ